MSHAGSVDCELHGPGYEHRPTPYDIERHHIWPVGMGGPDVEPNIIRACPTGHSDVHALLRMMLRDSRGHVPWSTRRRFGDRERKAAALAYLAVMGDEDVRTMLTTTGVPW